MKGSLDSLGKYTLIITKILYPKLTEDAMLILLQNGKEFLGKLNNSESSQGRKHSQNGLAYEKYGFGSFLFKKIRVQ